MQFTSSFPLITGSAFVCILAGGLNYLHAQDPEPVPTQLTHFTRPALVVLPGVPYVPLTMKQNFLYSFNKVFSGPSLMLTTFRAGLDQAGLSRHDNWGTGADSFGVRLASRFGRSLIRQNIAFGVRALDHEDPRYFVAGTGGMWYRTRHAMLQGVVAHKDNGTLIPAYSRLAADFLMPLIAREWSPRRFCTTGDVLRAGSMAVGAGMSVNVAEEFWPDIKRKLQRYREVRAEIRAEARDSTGVHSGTLKHHF